MKSRTARSLLFSDFHFLDYFPPLLRGFLYFTGYVAGRGITEEPMARYFTESRCALGTAGSHSLLVYLLQQPVRIGLFQLGGMLS